MTRASRSAKKGWDGRDNVNNEKSGSRCYAKQSKGDWDGDKSTTKWYQQNDSRLWEKQRKKDRDSRVKSTTSRATRGVEQTKLVLETQDEGLYQLLLPKLRLWLKSDQNAFPRILKRNTNNWNTVYMYAGRIYSIYIYIYIIFTSKIVWR